MITFFNTFYYFYKHKNKKIIYLKGWNLNQVPYILGQVLESSNVMNTFFFVIQQHILHGSCGWKKISMSSLFDLWTRWRGYKKLYLRFILFKTPFWRQLSPSSTFSYLYWFNWSGSWCLCLLVYIFVHKIKFSFIIIMLDVWH